VAEWSMSGSVAAVERSQPLALVNTLIDSSPNPNKALALSIYPGRHVLPFRQRVIRTHQCNFTPVLLTWQLQFTLS
jgi:hypothetical protein